MTDTRAVSLPDLAATLGDCVRYVDERVLLVCSDWQDVIDRLPVVDAVITDPPYSERTHKAQRVAAHLRMPTIEYQPVDAEWCDNFVSAAVTLQPLWVVTFCDQTAFRWYEEAWERIGWMHFAPVFVRDNPTPRFSGDGPAFGLEFISVARPRERRVCGSLPAYYHNTLNGFGGQRTIPGAKPVALMRALVRDYSRPGDLILDPCAGSGTTAVAARLEGRRCILVERDPNTAEIARRRVSHVPIETATGQTALALGEGT